MTIGIRIRRKPQPAWNPCWKFEAASLFVLVENPGQNPTTVQNKLSCPETDYLHCICFPRHVSRGYKQATLRVLLKPKSLHPPYDTRKPNGREYHTLSVTFPPFDISESTVIGPAAADCPRDFVALFGCPEFITQGKAAVQFKASSFIIGGAQVPKLATNGCTTKLVSVRDKLVAVRNFGEPAIFTIIVNWTDTDQMMIHQLKNKLAGDKGNDPLIRWVRDSPQPKILQIGNIFPIYEQPYFVQDGFVAVEKKVYQDRFEQHVYLIYSAFNEFEYFVGLRDEWSAKRFFSFFAPYASSTHPISPYDHKLAKMYIIIGEFEEEEFNDDDTYLSPTGVGDEVNVSRDSNAEKHVKKILGQEAILDNEKNHSRLGKVLHKLGLLVNIAAESLKPEAYNLENEVELIQHPYMGRFYRFIKMAEAENAVFEMETPCMDVCQKCNQIGHRKVNCDTEVEAAPKCFCCHGTGHGRLELSRQGIPRSRASKGSRRKEFAKQDLSPLWFRVSFCKAPQSVAQRFRRRQVKGVARAPAAPPVGLEDNYEPQHMPATSFPFNEASSTSAADAYATATEQGYQQAIQASLLTSKSLAKQSEFTPEDQEKMQEYYTTISSTIVTNERILRPSEPEIAEGQDHIGKKRMDDHKKALNRWIRVKKAWEDAQLQKVKEEFADFTQVNHLDAIQAGKTESKSDGSATVPPKPETETSPREVQTKSDEMKKEAEAAEVLKAEPAPFMGPDSMSSYKQMMSNGNVDTFSSVPAILEGQVVNPSGVSIVVRTTADEYIARPTASSSKRNEFIYYSESAINSIFDDNSFTPRWTFPAVEQPEEGDQFGEDTQEFEG
ncbi:hypothetical protein DL98DRAFT_539170 [Cadophora sp. DSE1049]|nr:hypothetical protein DL98DRAFT_539170 [Cadophora sp. DSE1049]